MRELKRLAAVSLVAGLLMPVLLTTPVPAQEPAGMETLEQYLKAVRGDLIARRDSAMSALLQMNEDQEKTFLGLRKAYDEEARQLGKVRLKLLREFYEIHDKLTPERADELAGQFFDLADQRRALRRKYYKLMSEQVSTVVAVQFLQLQGQFETMGELKLATYVPLAVE